MSIISLLPVMSISLGSLNIVKNGKKEQINYYGVFCSATKDKIYFLSGSDDIMIPRLVDLVKQPSLKLGSDSFNIELPATVLKTLFEFFAQPMTAIDGISLFDLYTQGFVSDTALGTSMLACIIPYAQAKGIDIHTIDPNKLIKLANIVKAGDQGFLQKTSLGEQIKGYLSSTEVNRPSQKREDAIKLEKFDKTDPADTVDISADTVDISADTVDISSENVNDKTDTDPVDVDLAKLNKRGLIKRAKMLGIRGWSKMTVKQLRDAIEEKLTDPAIA